MASVFVGRRLATVLLPPASVWWQGILPLRTHTPLEEGRMLLFGRKTKSACSYCRPKTFLSGENARKTDEDPNGKQTEQEPKRNRKPHVGSPRATPKQRNTKTRETEFRVDKDPKQARKTFLNLEDHRRVVEDREEEQAIPKRAMRNNTK